jgi:predicted polyphosphate/ATP-dependent NAD kinase
MVLVGFIINPIAGMGGRVGLKGTDDVAAEAMRRGAAPIAQERAAEALRELRRLIDLETSALAVRWLTASGAMGLDALRAAGFTAVEAVHAIAGESSARDTAACAAELVARGVGLVLFCGGDGTARDICAVTGTATAVLGIPSGVKMYSGVFGVTPARTAVLCLRFLKGEIGVAPVDVLDLDEEKLRAGEWAVRLHMAASTPFEPSLTQAGKAVIASGDDEAVIADIAAELGESIAADDLLLLGPGSTVQALARALGLDKTLLGIDAFAGGRPAGSDLAERQILELLDRHRRCRLVLSPIGAQGFVLGRGNQPLSPAVIRRIGPDNVIVVATPAKLARTPVLRFDSGDAALDSELIARRYLPVVIGYRRHRLVEVAG